MVLEPDLFLPLANFRHAMRRFLAASETISRDAGVTQQQYQAMLAIAAWPGGAMSVKDLSEELLLTHHAAVQLVDRLAKRVDEKGGAAITRLGEGFPGADICKNCPLIVFKKD